MYVVQNNLLSMSCYEKDMLIFNLGTLYDVHIGALNVLGCALFSMICNLLSMTNCYKGDMLISYMDILFFLGI